MIVDNTVNALNVIGPIFGTEGSGLYFGRVIQAFMWKEIWTAYGLVTDTSVWRLLCAARRCCMWNVGPFVHCWDIGKQ